MAFGWQLKEAIVALLVSKLPTMPFGQANVNKKRPWTWAKEVEKSKSECETEKKKNPRSHTSKQIYFHTCERKRARNDNRRRKNYKTGEEAENVEREKKIERHLGRIQAFFLWTWRALWEGDTIWRAVPKESEQLDAIMNRSRRVHAMVISIKQFCCLWSSDHKRLVLGNNFLDLFIQPGMLNHQSLSYILTYCYMKK